jgi:PAS domain S-box-containing protein
MGAVEESLCETPYSLATASRLEDALNLSLDLYLAIVLDESAAGGRLEDALDQLISRAPQASLVVACDPSSRASILTTLTTFTAEWIRKPIDGDELLTRLQRFARDRRIRTELEDSLYFIQRVADATPEMLYLFDVKDKYTLYVNRQTCDVLGCTPEGVPANKFMFFNSVVDPDDSQWVKNYLAGKLAFAKDGEVIQAEYRIRDRYYRRRWIHTREIVFHRDSQGRPIQILGSAQDITERKELEQVQALLATIVESSDDAIIGKSVGGKILSWNGGAERLYGYSASEVVGRNIREIVPPELHEEAELLLARIRLGDRVDHFRTRRQRKDGSCIDVSITISPIVDSVGRVIGASTIARRA